MVKNAKIQDNELFFVEVRYPEEVKRHILETLKDILELLHRFEKFKQVRHQKLEKIQKLRSLVKDANKMMAALKAKLPQTSLKGAVIKEEAPKPKKAHKKKKEAKEKPAKKESTELEKLEAELSAIESKLKSFS